MKTENEVVDYYQTTQLCVWTRRRPGESKSDIQVFVRWIEGIFFYGASDVGAGTPLRDLCLTAYMRGHYSSRPYEVARQADRSCAYCVLALVIHLCEERQWDRHAMYSKARVRSNMPFLPASCEGVKQQAQWEGLTYPKPWTRADVERLTDRLLDMGWDTLAAELERRLPSLSP